MCVRISVASLKLFAMPAFRCRELLVAALAVSILTSCLAVPVLMHTHSSSSEENQKHKSDHGAKHRKGGCRVAHTALFSGEIKEHVVSPRPHETMDVSELPDSFSWSDVDGTNYLTVGALFVCSQSVSLLQFPP